MHWSVEAMSEAIAQGSIEIGTPGAPQSVPATELLGAAATTVRVAMAELLSDLTASPGLTAGRGLKQLDPTLKATQAITSRASPRSSRFRRGG